MILGFTVGTTSHLYDIYKDGFLGYTFAPFILNLFWTSLVLLDTLVILLMFFYFRTSIYLAIFIMIFDIGINATFGLYSLSLGNTNILAGLITQIPFGIFIFVNSKILINYNSFHEAILKTKILIDNRHTLSSNGENEGISMGLGEK